MAEPEAPKRAVRGPFIMPDGRPLTAVLDQQKHLARRGGAPPKLRSGNRPKEPKEGWTKALPRAATAAAAAASAGDGAGLSDAEAAELYALSRVGQRKQRRWMNDKLLRDMAGALTATDMASLFKPIPFGEPRTSLWEQAAQPEHAVLWELFRSLEMDKQERVLQKWEAHVRELQASSAAIANPAVEAIAAWAGVSWKARQAMKRSNPSHVAGIEAPILAFLQEGEGDELVLADLEDGFHRLIAHGLAEYHSLSSHSRPLPGGDTKQVVLRRRASSTAAAAAAASTAAASSSSAAAAGGGAAGTAASAGAGPAAAAGGGEAAAAGSAQQAQQAGSGMLAISCADILHILFDEGKPLCPAILHQAYLHPIDSSSEAGDHPYYQQHAAAAEHAAHPHHHHAAAAGAAAVAPEPQMTVAAT